MLAVMLVAVLFDRAALTMRNLAISAIAVILVSPHEVVGPSFQMSFAATAALVGAYAGFADYRAGKTTAPAKRSFLGFVSRKLAIGVGGAAVTSLIAGSATLLFAIWHFQRVSPLSLLANLAVMPIVSLIVMPFAVLSALAMPFGFDGPFLFVMGKGLMAMIAISAWISERSPVDAVGLISIQSVLLATVALVIATMATTWLRLVPRYPSRSRRCWPFPMSARRMCLSRRTRIWWRCRSEAASLRSTARAPTSSPPTTGNER
jgi:competence protein ComEC